MQWLTDDFSTRCTDRMIVTNMWEIYSDKTVPDYSATVHCIYLN